VRCVHVTVCRQSEALGSGTYALLVVP
jgi:hypothetical protein